MGQEKGCRNLKITTTMTSMIMISLVGLLIVSLIGVIGMYRAKEGQGILYMDRSNIKRIFKFTKIST